MAKNLIDSTDIEIQESGNDINLILSDEVNKRINGIILFQNDSGQGGNLTLNDSVANYNKIEIFYKATPDNINRFGSAIIDMDSWTANSQYSLDVMYNDGGDVIVYTQFITINTTSLTKLTGMYAIITAPGNKGTTDLLITKVVGYK